MAETKRIIKFTVDKKTKRPMSLCESNIVFALYTPRRIKLEPEHFVNVPMNIKIDLPRNIIETHVIPPSLPNFEIKITDYRTI